VSGYAESFLIQLERTMKLLRYLVCASCFGSLMAVAHAQAPAGAPAGSTVQCNDGSFASPPKKSGACRGHQGIKVWFGPDTATPAAKPAAAASAAPAKPAATAAAPAQSAAPAKPAAAPKAAAPKAAAQSAPAPGGGPGKVWANMDSKVYHCPGDRYYGTTKNGQYMSEADAKAKGMHPSHNKACS
jgi:hypothetical protein